MQRDFKILLATLVVSTVVIVMVQLYLHAQTTLLNVQTAKALGQEPAQMPEPTNTTPSPTPSTSPEATKQATSSAAVKSATTTSDTRCPITTAHLVSAPCASRSAKTSTP